MQPVIVGVADIKNRSLAVEDAKEPATLMLEAIQAAINDACTSDETAQILRDHIDSLSVVQTWTWPYQNLPGLLSQWLGVNPKHQTCTEHGGNQPAKLLDEAALRITRGEATVAVITGGEALASLASCVKHGKMPPPGWSSPAQNVTDVFSPTNRELRKDIAGLHSVGSPIHVYPLYENGFRAHREQSLQENHDESAALYGYFSKVASQNPYAWNYGVEAETATSIGTISKRNRMICSPYPLLMNAFNTVNLSAACIVTTTELARRLQIPEDKWIYPLGGAGSKERENFWERPNFFHSTAISKALDTCLSVSQLTSKEIDLYDFYSCFPIVPKLACHHLGISIREPQKPITLLGGLTSFGGAGNNYSMHAITEMTRRLRQGSSRNGLILANGGILSYQHAICMSSSPPKEGTPYPDSEVLGRGELGPIPPVDFEAEGPAKIETYTVEFKRDGTPLRAYIVGRLTYTNHRFLANEGDKSTLLRLASSHEEPIGKLGTVIADPSGLARPQLLRTLRPRAYRLGSRSLYGRATEFLQNHNPDLSESQRMVRQEIAKICSDFPDNYWAKVDETHQFPTELYEALASQGWLGICLPQRYGGSELGISEAAVMMQTIAESGGGMTGASSIHMNIFGLEPVAKFGTDEQKERWLTPLIAGRHRACFGVTEPNTGLDTLQLQATARRSGTGYILSGQKIWISTAQRADKILILVRTTPRDRVKKPSQGLSLFYTDLQVPQVQITEIPKMGRAAVDTNSLFFDDWHVPEVDRVGQEDEGFRMILHGMNAERILIGAEALGLGFAALRRAALYANERQVFGRPIGQNQGIQHPLADSWMKLEAARMMIYQAARLYDQGYTDGEYANAGKYLAAEAAFEACERAIWPMEGWDMRRNIMSNGIFERSSFLALPRLVER
ncbi:uncharacterized protein N7515_004630 [Penicillium bovifimosum]|uniref:Uncharacterized protein n=1 Tax=Penicillium bovifimosum TaxID=126998 RepID=A0A9W9H0H2_9EURO|nr:uncharacterized protein N7515_004630 [Penicillium bovifimosum]KAJ5135352.1 hypothetical protein N7515_004630 [Penicillium bovifimosum]